MSTTRTLHKNNYCAKNRTKRYMVMIIIIREKPLKITSTQTSVIKRKGESQNGCFTKTKPARFSEKRTFLTP